jgi:hypothetical protein
MVNDKPEYFIQFEEAISTAKDIANSPIEGTTAYEEIIAVLYYKLKDIHRLVNSGEYDDSALVDEVINRLSDLD